LAAPCLPAIITPFCPAHISSGPIKQNRSAPGQSRPDKDDLRYCLTAKKTKKSQSSLSEKPKNYKLVSLQDKVSKQLFD